MEPQCFETPNICMPRWIDWLKESSLAVWQAMSRIHNVGTRVLIKHPNLATGAILRDAWDI